MPTSPLYRRDIPGPRAVARATTALEVTGDATVGTMTAERVYHATPPGDVWTHPLGEPCSVPRCMALDSFAGLERYRP